jgi:hypothetical protein
MRVRYLTFRFFCAEADAAAFLLAGVNRDMRRAVKGEVSGAIAKWNFT